jgi:hypothetical protein
MSAIRWTFVIIGLISGSALFGWYLGELYSTDMTGGIAQSKEKITASTEKTKLSTEVKENQTNMTLIRDGIKVVASLGSTEVKENQTNMTLNSYSSQTIVEQNPVLTFKYSDRTRP